MAGIIGTTAAGTLQDLWIVGSRFYFQSDLRNLLVDFGTIDVVNPAIEPTKVELRDGASGLLKIVDSSLTEISETYEIVCKNFSRDNLTSLFLSSAPAILANDATGISYSNAALAVGDIFLLRNSANLNKPVYNLLTLGTVTNGTAVIHDAARGLVRCTSITGTLTITGATATAALTNNRGLLAPQGGSISSFAGRAQVFYGRDNNATQSVREFRCQLIPSSASFSTEDYSTFTMSATALYEPTQTTAPFGSFCTYVGSVG